MRPATKLTAVEDQIATAKAELDAADRQPVERSGRARTAEAEQRLAQLTQRHLERRKTG